MPVIFRYIFFLFFLTYSFSQRPFRGKEANYLLSLLKSGKKDTFLLALQHKTDTLEMLLTRPSEYSMPDSLLEMYLTNIVAVTTTLGKYYAQTGNLDSSYYYFRKNIDLIKLYPYQEKRRIRKFLAGTYLNLGSTLVTQDNIQEGLKYYDKSAKLFLRVQDTLRYTMLLYNIAETYKKNENYEEAIEYLKKAERSLRFVKPSKASGKKRKLSLQLLVYNSLINTGIEQKRDSLVYFYLPYLDTLIKGGEVEQKIALPPTVFLTYAKLYLYENKFDKIESFLEKASEAMQEQKNFLNLYEINFIRGKAAYKEKKYAIAERYFLKALEELNRYMEEDLSAKVGVYVSLYENAKKLKNYKQAVNYLEKIRELQKQMDLKSRIKSLTRVTTRIEMEKQILAEQLKREKEQAIAEEKLKRQRLIIYGALGILLLFVVFLGILFNRYQIIRKQKKALLEASAEIEAQNELLARQNRILEEKNKIIQKKNKDILDSILAAKRIQTAFIPPEALLQSFFYDAFVIYLPRDHVSGDFYWVGQENQYKYLAVADCTGHGIPAAMLSMLGQMSLNTALKELDDAMPANMLRFMQEYIIEALMRYGSNLNEGLELSILRWDTQKNTLQIASAKRFVLVYGNTSQELLKLKGSSYSIGPGELWKKEKGMDIYTFSQENIFLEPEEVLTVYMTSDGFIDQFGGSKNKKLGSKKFFKLIQSIVELPMEVQKETLLKFLEKWQGNQPQLDDITLVAVKIKQQTYDT